jgi:hypothetical protein
MDGKRPANELPGELNEENRKRQKIDDILQAAEKLMRNLPTTSSDKLNWIETARDIQNRAYQLKELLNSQQRETIEAMMVRLQELETIYDPEATQIPLEEEPAASTEDEDEYIGDPQGVSPSVAANESEELARVDDDVVEQREDSLSSAEMSLSRLEEGIGQPTQSDTLNPARRTRNVSRVEERLQSVLGQALNVMKASRDVSGESASKKVIQDITQQLTSLLNALRDMPQERAKVWRTLIIAELARLTDAWSSEMNNDNSDERSEELVDKLPPGNFSVETILDRYASNEHTYYYVKWEGYAVGIDAWQPSENVELSLILDFEDRYGDLDTGEDDLRRIVRKDSGQKYTAEANRGYAVELKRANMLPITQRKAEAFDAEDATRRREGGGGGSGGGGGGGGGGRPSAAGLADDEESDDEEVASGDLGDGGITGQAGRLLVWDSNTSDLRLSVGLALSKGNFQVGDRILWDSLIEWTVTRLWLLETVVPPESVINNTATLDKIAKTYYNIEKDAFDSGFKKGSGATFQEHYDNQVAQMVGRMRLRWQRLRLKTTRERDVLRSQLRALRRIGHVRGFGPPPLPPPAPDAAADQLVADAANAANARWWVAYASPAARSTKQNNLVRYRNAETKRFLYWMRQQWYSPTRKRSLQSQKTDEFGSVFDGDIPTSALEASVTQVEHTVAQSWFENTELMQEFCHVRDDINNTLPVPAMQNAKKGARPIWFVSDVPSDPDKVDHSWFAPEERDRFSPQRQAAVAARIFYIFLSNPLVTQQNDAQSALQRKGGCAYYANPHVHDHMLKTVRTEKPLVHDAYVNLVILYVYRTYNPLLMDPSLLDKHEFAADFRELLKERLEGSTSFPALCGAALQSAVVGFPSRRTA